MKRKWLFTFLKGSLALLLACTAALGGFLLVRPEVAYAVRDVTEMAQAFVRFDIEILQPAPYGRYYDALYWKHYDELKRIVRAHPEYGEEIVWLMNLFMPHVEAVLDGRGEEVRVTQAQVEALAAFSERLQAVANEALRADIERELQRTPLQDFVGLTMDETLASIEAAWERDFGGVEAGGR